MFITITVVMTNFCSYKVPSESIKNFGFFIYSKTKRRKNSNIKTVLEKFPIFYDIKFHINNKLIFNHNIISE